MVGLLSITAALAATVLPNIVSAVGLDQAAVAKGLQYFGTATDNPELTDIPYVTQLNNTADFGQITPGNSMKWDATEPSQGTFTFTKGDVIADLAEGNGQYLRCHTLVWYNQLPSWVTSGTWTNATLTAALKNHITNVVSHYKGKCLHWDVLFYNDYNLEYGGAKAASARAIVQLVKNAGAKIDGVGLQAHFSVGTVPSTSSLVSVLQSFTALGVEVAYTEADVRILLPTTATTLAQQSSDFQALVQSCVQTTGCVGFTIWDWTDKYSWVPSTFSGYGAALPWDENLVKKPAYNGLLAGMGVTVTTTTTTTTATATGKTTTTTTGATSTGTTAAHWGQCGGLNWSGPTACATGYTCTYVNDYYSQCL
ncbi:putative endo-1,4-beta-xylanase [Aspergillus fijiensis CBS 313.89]|uniref:endo-1,4-beta-xylanase n=1 Tax=Aspergillus fijiensis CBS 313.89 TaxID=1448319 RepID=A0A8G1VVX7_9EURO|nr:beta-1,4-endoxylanase [Aspergillus fijiensis CBS 313.89]RAK74985.1 beta-1,4-endoxylanase [Aspergillus fijiensis CBS 313.89]